MGLIGEKSRGLLKLRTITEESDQNRPFSSNLPEENKERELLLDKYFCLVGNASSEELKDIISEKSVKKSDVYFFPQNTAPEKFPIEVLYLKINAFLKLVKQLLSFQSASGRNYKNLKKILVSMPPSDDHIPLFWNISILLSEPDGSCSAEGGGEPYLSTLGILLLNALLVNDATSREELEKHITALIAGIQRIVKKGKEAQEEIRHFILDEMRLNKEIFGSENILYQETDRLKSKNIVPEDIWDETIILAISLVSGKNQGVSTNEEESESTGNLSLEEIIEPVSEIAKLVKLELFHGQTQETEFCEALGDILG